MPASPQNAAPSEPITPQAARALPAVDRATHALLDSYAAEERTRHLDSPFLPSRARTIDIIEVLRKLLFPGYFEDLRLTQDNVRDRTATLIAELYSLLQEQARQSLRYELNRTQPGVGDDCDDCDQVAHEKTEQFLDRLPDVRALLAADVQATFDGDPAAANTDELIFSYPGIDAIFTHRVAHCLHALGVPMLPRIMSEYAHNETGVDIHPAATIGEGFCIDHGTGIVVGETCVIGRNVKLYQGVTLGALSLRGGHDRWAGRKRHPTIEDNVTIYGGAIILGGQTVIGKDAVIGGSVFITHSIPAGHTVTMAENNLKITPPKEKRLTENAD
ncbi:MAG: serine O-acetyltransferase [Planctomycetota bacterium]